MTASMLDYIIRQPEILKRTFDRRNEFLEPFQRVFQNHSIKRIYFFGSGTSHHVSRLGAMYFNRYLKAEASAHEPIPFADREPINPCGVYKEGEILAVGVSQSGTSTSTIQALEKAKAHGCITMCFSQDKDSHAVKISDEWIPMICEKELVPPETQGYTAAILTLYLSAAALSGKDSAEKEKEAERFLCESLPLIIERSYAWVKQHWEDFANAKKLTIYGSGLNEVTAMEGALKISECLKRVVSSCESEEFAHLVDLSILPDDYCFALVHPDFHPSRNVEILNLTRDITSHVYTISPDMCASVNDLALGCAIPSDLSPIAYVVPLQLFAALVARQLGIDTSRFPRDDIQGISHSSDYFLYQK